MFFLPVPGKKSNGNTSDNEMEQSHSKLLYIYQVKGPEPERDLVQHWPLDLSLLPCPKRMNFAWRTCCYEKKFKNILKLSIILKSVLKIEYEYVKSSTQDIAK